MPHVGGGGHGGGFHVSSGGHISGGGSHYNSTRRYDNHGHLHSPYYRRPGFYYRGYYIPYTRRERESSSNYAGQIFLFVISAILVIVALLIALDAGNYNENKLERYALNQYSEIYDSKSIDYESNVLVTIVTYEDATQFDYISIVGDKVDYSIDNRFGGHYSTFGSSLLQKIPTSENHSNLYANLKDSLDPIANDYEDIQFLWTSRYLKTTEKAKSLNSCVLNRTSFKDFDDENLANLTLSCQNFYTKTGYNISFLITDNNQAYSPDWVAFGVLIGFAGVFVLIGISSIAKKKEAIKHVEEEINLGNASKYYEGEDPFDEYYKNHPMY